MDFFFKVDTVRKNITVNNKDPQNRGEPPKTYSFDSVYAPDAKQLDIYNETARPIVDFVLEGYNGVYKTVPLYFFFQFSLHMDNK